MYLKKRKVQYLPKIILTFNNNNAADKKNLFKNSQTPTLAEKISIILLNS